MTREVIEQAGRDGVQLRGAHFRAEAPRGTLLLLHGYGEHSGRFSHVIERVVGGGFDVVTYDHRGHGASTGLRRGLIDRFEALVADARSMLEHCEVAPVFVYGHSMGGLIATRLVERGEDRIAGAILTSAALMPAGSIPAPLVKVANVLGTLLPGLPTIALDGNAISRDDAVRADYDADPMNYRGKLTARTGAEMNRAMHQALAEATRITVPLLVLHGTADALTSVEGSRELVRRVGSADVTFREFPDAYHELHNEPEREEVIDVICSWLLSHA